MAQHIKENNKTYTLKGYGGTIHTFGLKIPLTAATWEEFAEKMRKSEEELQERIAKGVSSSSLLQD